MINIWNKIEDLAIKIEHRFAKSGEEYQESLHDYDWYNKLYRSERYRRAHVEIVDKRQDHGIYILHTTVFPHFNDCSPIWGFDAICGANKITGAFHDFSPAGDDRHEMIKWFFNKTSQCQWSKPRQLPEWAKQIFSPWMIAAGNIHLHSEIDNLCTIALETLDYYLDNVGITQESGSEYYMAQNRYCYYQKQNPQVIKSMTSMGVPKETITEFVDKVLFPEVT